MAESGDASARTGEISDLENRIIRQVEYYFGDMNLPWDKFLRQKIKEDDGWVTMDTMLNFNRLKTISSDKDVIIKALRKSSSGLMEVSDDCTKIRRSPEKPLPDNIKEKKDDICARSVYVKGFPVDCTLDSLMEFFEKYGKIDSIFMRRNKPDKTFKGSVYVTFSNMDEEKVFLEKDSIKYNDTELLKMTKHQYFQKKAEEVKQKRRNSTAADEKEKAEKKKEEEEKKMEEQMTKGAVLFLKGLSKETTMEEVKTFFGDYGNVAWVEYAKGDEKALVRFHEGEAQAALDKTKAAGGGKVVINDAELETRVLDGEEEKEHWRKMFRDIADRRLMNKNKKIQNRKRKFGGQPNKQVK